MQKPIRSCYLPKKKPVTAPSLTEADPNVSPRKSSARARALASRTSVSASLESQPQTQNLNLHCSMFFSHTLFLPCFLAAKFICEALREGGGRWEPGRETRGFSAFLLRTLQEPDCLGELSRAIPWRWSSVQSLDGIITRRLILSILRP
jgi:hypothetical protein